MTALMLLMLFPVLLVICMKIFKPEQFSWSEAIVQLVFTGVLIFGVHTAGKYSEMSATEYWTGTVQSKQRDHDHYVRTYDCNCVSVSCGKNCTTRVCSTCYEDHYTVDWYLTSTIGKIRIDYIDSTSRSVYKKPDPVIYVNAVPGEACSRPNTYLNYVRAADLSLLNISDDGTVAKSHKVPPYPQLYHVYKLNRVVSDGVNLPGGLAAWNLELENYMKNLGGLKQINIFVVFTKEQKTSYAQAVRARWLGGNKNDAVIVVGVQDNKITWADSFSWSKNARYDVEIRQEIGQLGELDKANFFHVVNETVLKYYERRPMAEFEYLKDEIDPPMWAMGILIAISIVGSLLLALLFYRIDLDQIVADLFDRIRRGY